MVQKPRFIVIAGPNGAGKSTFTRNAQSLSLPVIDPDAEARAINPDNPELVAVAAGRVAIRRAREYLSNNQSFAVETTLSGSTYLKMMRDAKAARYETNLIYVGIDDVETNIGRVATRILAGGHGVPDEDVRRRYERSLNNLPKAIELADNVLIYDNSTSAGYQIILTIVEGEITQRVETLPNWLKNYIL